MANTERDISELVQSCSKTHTSASKCGLTKTKFYTATKSYFYGHHGFFAVTNSSNSGEVTISSARSRAMLIKFYRLHSVTEKCLRAIFISFILFGLWKIERLYTVAFFKLLSLSIQVSLCHNCHIAVRSYHSYL